ncbi:MAG: TonB-dependent receptor, partial [Bdellovibrionales bacterium]|nr:TonB-dependent receptor [Bdellovibrionales bacterium]
ERNSLARNLPTDVEMINRGYQAGAEVGLAWKRDDSLQVLTGLNYEFSHADPYLFEEVATGNPTASSPWRDSHSVSDYSLFAQALYNHDTPHQWTFGGRFNHNEDSKGVFSPRVGYVWAVNPTTTFKALYAQAFRNPDFFEKQVNTPGVLIGDDKLEHEKVQSLDLALELIPEDSNLKHVANVFYLVASDIISRAATATPGEFQYKNGSDNHFWGLEYSLKTGMVNHRSWFLSYSYKEGHDDTNDVALKYLAKHSGSAGLTWQVGSQLAASPNMIYVGRREDVGDFALFNLTLSYAINKDWSASL